MKTISPGPGIVCGLIKGRHSVPSNVKTFVFDADIPQEHISDPVFLEQICTNFLDLHRPELVSVYVTGFTPALLALIKVCNERDIGLDAYNYDREAKTFWRQEVL